MNSSPAEIFFIIAIFQLLFISFFLFSHDKGPKISNQILGTFFLSIALNLLDSFLVLNQQHLGNSLWIGWGICIPLLFGPLLYLYTQSILFKDFKLIGKKWLHFLPFMVLFAATEIKYITESAAFRQALIDRISQTDIPTIFYFTSGIIFWYFFIYAGASLRLIARYKQLARDSYSDQQRVNISWLRSTILFFTGCIVMAALNGYLRLTPLSKYYYFTLAIVLLLMIVFINRVLLKALRHPELFSIIPPPLASPVQPGPEQPPGQSNLLQTPGAKPVHPELAKLKDQLLEYMEQHRPYLEPELSLEDLARRLSLRPRLLSHVINECLRQNFFDFINRYRIEAARQLLAHPKDPKMTILEVLYEVGFNSKSSFNTLFRKYTGLTPSDFKKTHPPQ